jgi:polar amino acid transport system substrate-binding protein
VDTERDFPRTVRAWLRLFALALLAAAGRAATPALVIDVDESNPPYMYALEGQAAGVYPALIRAAFLRMGEPVDLQAVPWKRAIQELENGTVGIGGIYKNAERLRRLDYSEQLFTERLLVFFNVRQPLAFSQIEDLVGKRVGVIRGWSYGDRFDQLRQSGAILAEEVASDEQNFRKLDAHHLDAAIAIDIPGLALMGRFQDLGCGKTPLAIHPTFLAFAKTARRTPLLQRFDQALRELKKGGEFQRIVDAELGRLP